MFTLLSIITVLLIVVAVGCALIYLWLNNFSAKSDIIARNKSLLKMMKITMAGSMITALLSGLLSNADTVERAISATVSLYFTIAISMLVVLLAVGGVLIFRYVSNREFPEGTSSGVTAILKIATVGASVSLILAWLLS